MNTAAPIPAPRDEFPIPRRCPFTPPKAYEELSPGPPRRIRVAGSELPAWLIGDYQQIKEVLLSPAVSSSRKLPGFPFYFHAPPEFRTETSFIGEDGAEHARQRRRVAVSFTHRQVARLRPRIEQVVDERIDAMLAAGPPLDFHRFFSLPVPMTVICEILGVPHDQHDFLIGHGTVLLGGTSTEAARRTAMLELNSFIADLITEKEKHRGDDVISRALEQYAQEDEQYDRRDVFNMVRLLINGGHETTANMLSLGTAYLLEHPELIAQLQREPDMIDGAVEELIRLASIADLAVPRVALEDLVIGGVRIPKGDGIICLSLAANRDAQMFPEPHEAHFERGNRKHLAFGHGPHYCIGADLARLELRVAWSRLFDRLPTLALGRALDDLDRKEGAVIYGVHHLPITWDPAAVEKERARAVGAVS